MDNFSYYLGVVVLIISLAIRFAFSPKRGVTKLQDWAEEGMPFNAETPLSLMGILWIIIGIIITLGKKWFEAGFFHDTVVQPLLISIPFFLFKWFIDKYRRNK